MGKKWRGEYKKNGEKLRNSEGPGEYERGVRDGRGRLREGRRGLNGWTYQSR